MRAIRVDACGGPEVLVLREVDGPVPGPEEARVHVRFAGVNFIDVYHRTGAYPVELPFVPGMEGAGVVEAVGRDVRSPKLGDRVAFAMQMGCYSQAVIVPATKLVLLPAALSLEQGAGAMLQGMTAHYLTRSTFPLQKGQVAVVHAAAGGVGLLLVQMARRLGARVVAVVSTPEKAARVRALGADHVVVGALEQLPAQIAEFTNGEQADVVYDSVGRDSFEHSLKCLKARGMLVSYGQSSGFVPPLDLRSLSAKSLFLTRPSLAHYTTTRAELEARAADLFGDLASGRLSLAIHAVYQLEAAADAHRALQSRATSGKILLRMD